jgi:hypothetical protein
VLLELVTLARNDSTGLIEKDRARARRTLVEGEDIHGRQY